MKVMRNVWDGFKIINYLSLKYLKINGDYLMKSGEVKNGLGI